MSLDHGALNVPLSKRGNIDRDIDRLKAAEAKASRERSRAHVRLLREAQRAVKQLHNELVDMTWRDPAAALARVQTFREGSP
jgi:hypothetical protein